MTQATTPQPAADASNTLVQFGIAEVSYLLSLGKSEGSARSREALKINDQYFSTAMVGAGASSLLARGFASVTGDDIDLTGPSQMLAYAFGTAQRWTEMALLGTEEVEAALYIQAPGISVFLQPAALGVWAALFKLPEASDADMLKLIIDTKLSSDAKSALYFGSTALTGEERKLFVRHDESDAWSTAWVTDPNAAPNVTLTSTAGLMATLAELSPAIRIDA